MSEKKINTDELLGETEVAAKSTETAKEKIDYNKEVTYTFPLDNSEKASKTITVRFGGKSYRYERGEQVMIPYKLFRMLKRKDAFFRKDRAYRSALEKKLKEISK